MTPLFETEDLVVRSFRSFETEECLNWLADPKVMEYVEAPFDYVQTEAFLGANAFLQEPRIYAVEQKEDGRLAGHLILHPFEQDSYELGWILASASQQKGYATQLTKAALEWAREKGISALIIECDRRQKASIALAEHNGFRLYGSDGSLLQYRYDFD